jgi:hypothetical protein
MADDNSCLFHAVAFLLAPEATPAAPDAGRAVTAPHRTPIYTAKTVNGRRE